MAEFDKLFIRCPSDMTVFKHPGKRGAVVNFPEPTVMGGVPPIKTVCSPASGTLFPAGITTVSCRATDAKGNVAECSFEVKVILNPFGCLGRRKRRCKPLILVNISVTEDPCRFMVNGSVSCSGRPTEGAIVNLDASFTGAGAVTIEPNQVITGVDGVFTASLEADPCTNGTALVTATTKIVGKVISAADTTSIQCPPNRILAPGGEINGAIATTGVVEYSCDANAWVTRTPLPNSRESHAAGGLLPDGKIIISNGFSPSAFNGIDTANKYDPLTNAWSPAASSNVARGSLQGAIINGLFYTAGGTTGSRSGVLATVEIYDPENDAWSLGTPLPSARSELAVVALNGFLHAIGGYNGANEIVTHNVLDPETMVWESAASLPQALAFGAATVFGGRIYFFGGRSENIPSPTVYIYDPSEDSWSLGTPMPTPRWGTAAAICGSEIFVMGGFNPALGYLNVVEAYNPATNTWRTNVAPMPVAKALFPAISFC